MFKSKQCLYIPAADVKEVNKFLVRHGFGPKNFSRKVKDNLEGVYFICSLLITDAMTEKIKSKFTTVKVSKSSEASVKIAKGFNSIGRAPESEV